MKKAMHRQTLLQIARLQSDNDLVVAVNPDHPYLLSPPDVLVGSNGRLLAAYFPHIEEQKDPNSILARLALARLALPEHTQHILVLSKDMTRLSIKIIDQSFDKIMETPEINKFHILLKELNRRDTYELQKTKETHFLKFNAIYQASIKQLDRRPHETSTHDAHYTWQEEDNDNVMVKYEKAYFRDWTRESGRKQNPSKLFSKTSWGHFSSLETAPDSRVLRRLCLGSIRLIADLDNGIPFTGQYDTNLLLTTRLSSSKHDPLKALRGTAFSGLAFCPANSLDSAGKYSHYITTQVEQITYEYNKKKNRRVKRSNIW